MKGDLTSLARVKEWLAPGSGALASGNDAMLQRLVTTASKFLLNYCGRAGFAATAHDEWMDSGGRDFIVLRQWPVISVSSVQFDGQSYGPSGQALANPPATGSMLLEPPPESGGQQRLTLWGVCFPQRRSAVRALYTAGFQTSESYLIASATSDKYVTQSTWIQDDGVTINGVAATLVASAPAAGQYTYDSTGYTFSASDNGKTAVITYSYVPADVEQACIELVGERFRQRDRIGQNSKSLPSGEVVSFLVKDMSEYIKTSLQPFRRITPA